MTRSWPASHTGKNIEIDEMESHHAAEKLAHRRFGVAEVWIEQNFDAQFRATLPPGLAARIQSLPCFFIATANLGGECDCSFRGREYAASGRPTLLVKVIDSKTLVFPDYSGNNFFNSLGNILVNGQIGMLFVDFEARLRVRINGKAEIIDDSNMYSEIWPLARRYVRVTTEQVFGNCGARIPRMKLVKPADNELQDE